MYTYSQELVSFGFESRGEWAILHFNYEVRFDNSENIFYKILTNIVYCNKSVFGKNTTQIIIPLYYLIPVLLVGAYFIICHLSNGTSKLEWNVIN